MEFKDKVAVITGGASGIGRAVSLAFAKFGANIVLADKNDKMMDEVCGQIISSGRRAIAVHCDVSNNNDIEKLVAQTIAVFGRVDILMNNAGIAAYGKLDNITIAEYESILNVNFLGIVRCVLAFLPYMLKRGSGYIINTSSQVGLRGRPEPYCISKYVVFGYSEGLYEYLRPKGIMVSVLCPSLINTNLRYNSTYVGSDEEVREIKTSMEQRFTDGECILPEEVAGTLISAMHKEKFIVLTRGTEPFVDDSLKHGRDFHKLEMYFKSNIGNQEHMR